MNIPKLFARCILVLTIMVLLQLSLWAASGWYVVTYSGQAVAGPFTLLSDCTEMANTMHAKYFNVSEVCQNR